MIKIYTDGSCIGNPGPGGWAAIILNGDKQNIVSGKKKLQPLIKKMEQDRFHITIVERSDFLAKHIRDADFAIASNGRTVFEIGALNVPLIAVSVKSIEQNHSFVEDASIGFHVNFYKKIDEDLIKKRINQMMSFRARQNFIRNLEKIDLLKGVDRVINKIMHEYEKNNN